MHAFEDAAAVIEAVDVVIVAVKPYMIERVLGPVVQLLADKVVLSVAAGWDCEAYERVIPGTRHLWGFESLSIREVISSLLPYL